jgi:cupin 2 domain-containing protein
MANGNAARDAGGVARIIPDGVVRMTIEMTTGNLYTDAESPSPQGERYHELLAAAGVRIARIESNAHSSAEDFWYDQDDDEWVAIIAGDAVLELADGTWHAMGTGDWIVIPAHTRHRIVGTSDRTLWLAVYIDGAARGSGPLLAPSP